MGHTVFAESELFALWELVGRVRWQKAEVTHSVVCSR